MSREITTTVTVYTYAELDDKAKERARDWYRQCADGDNFFSESITDDLKEVGAACGLEFGGRNPNNRSDKGIYWEGFSHQGSGASFTASWQASRVDLVKLAALRADRPATYTDAQGKLRTCAGNAELAPILGAFAALAADEPAGYGSVTASNRGHSLTVEYGHDNDDARDSIMDENEAALQDACVSLADWYYRSLEREYEYFNSDEAVAESIEANENEFTATGERYDA